MKYGCFFKCGIRITSRGPRWTIEVNAKFSIHCLAKDLAVYSPARAAIREGTQWYKVLKSYCEFSITWQVIRQEVGGFFLACGVLERPIWQTRTKASLSQFKMRVVFVILNPQSDNYRWKIAFICLQPSAGQQSQNTVPPLSLNERHITAKQLTSIHSYNS